ncbi:MAG: hypothetical protein NE328_04680 [Lentisphaeraceae bacterium]|nr:hypothetical protein [Lentisphaeraceae bacterium]
MENESTENEHKMKAVIAIVAVLLIAILLFVGKYIFPDIDGTINAIVKNSNDAFTQLNNPEVIDARSYRDGKNNGVVLEYTFSKKKSEEKIDAVLRKQKLIENLKKQDLEKILSHGIYFKVIYKNYKSRDLLQIKISAEDLSH